MSYYDLDDILAEEQPIKVKVVVSMHNDDDHPSKLAEMFQKDQEVTVPLWYAMYMAHMRVVQPKIPAFLSMNSLQVLESSPLSTNLASKSPYFYEIALKIMSMYRTTHPDYCKLLSRTILTCLYKRYTESIGPNSYVRSSDPNSNSTTERKVDLTYFATLSELEKVLYRDNERCLKLLQQWRNDTISVRAHDIVVHSVKRQRPNP